MKSKIPNPAAGTNNWYTEDGYGGGSFGSSSFRRRILQRLLGSIAAGRRARS